MEKLEPFEMLTVDVEEQNQGAIMEELGRRKGDLQDMQPDGKGRVRLEYRIPARGLIGFQGEFMTLTRGTGVMSHVFDDYGPVRTGEVGERRNGVLVSQDDGEAVAYALWKLQERGRMFVSPGDKLYEGMIIGIHSRDTTSSEPVPRKAACARRAGRTHRPRAPIRRAESAVIHRRQIGQSRASIGC
jgi:GTP-binding protein